MKEEKVPDFPTHAQKAIFLRSRELLITSEGNRNLLFARGIKAAKRYHKRLAEDQEFARTVVDLANE